MANKLANSNVKSYICVVSHKEWPEQLDDMVSWSEENCKEDWAYGLHHMQEPYKLVFAFYFYDVEDWTAFSLIWGLI